ncbi:MAG: SDR family oxidoreductase [Deltaproteobacteria bacterium]|nr:MAG: SDR family oxidoreductase [Deltaproteobacteria bacterium]
MKIDGKVIWITGASSGIGEALAIELSKRNCKLILSSRRESALLESKARCSGEDSNIAILPVDLEKTQELTEKAIEAEKIFGRIDILINNGGISQRSLVLETELNVYSRLMTINYLGAVALSKAILPGQIERGEGFHVAITSLVGKFGTPLRSGYSASKHALHGFYDSMRAELHDQGIKAMLVCPGFIKTNVSVNAFVGDGSSQGTMDSAQENGMEASVFAKKMIAAMEAEKEEICIGGKEKIGVLIKRFFPGLFSSMIKKAQVT